MQRIELQHQPELVGEVPGFLPLAVGKAHDADLRHLDARPFLISAARLSGTTILRRTNCGKLPGHEGKGPQCRKSRSSAADACLTISSRSTKRDCGSSATTEA